MAKFSKGDKVESVKTGAKGIVDEVYGDEKYAVLFDGATNPDRVEGFQIKAANGCAKNDAPLASTNTVVQNAINARRARNADGDDVIIKKAQDEAGRLEKIATGKVRAALKELEAQYRALASKYEPMVKDASKRNSLHIWLGEYDTASIIGDAMV